MRDPARIDRMIEILRETWKLAPDMRIVQLLGFSTPFHITSKDYYMEDDLVEKCMADALVQLRKMGNHG